MGNADLSSRSDEAKGTLLGKRLAGINQPGARLFNQEELARVLRVGNCIPCHDSYDDEIYQNMGESYRFAKTQSHRDLRMRILSEE